MTNAGWHPDPLERHQLRFFDGEEWTPHVVDGSDIAFDPLAPSTTDGARGAASDSQAEAPTAKRNHHVQWLVLAGVLVVAAAATLGAVAFAGSSGPKTAVVRGSFAIRNSSDGTHLEGDGAGGCQGASRFRDLNAHTAVEVDGDRGNRLTQTTLGEGHVAGDSCLFNFTFTVKKGESYYVVTVGNRATSQYTFAELEQPDAVALVLAE